MRNLKWVILALVIVGALFSIQAWAADKQLVIYMQCGGTQGMAQRWRAPTEPGQLPRRTMSS